MNRNYEKWVLVGFLVLVAGCGGNSRGRDSGLAESKPAVAAGTGGEIRVNNELKNIPAKNIPDFGGYRVVGVIDRNEIPADIQNFGSSAIGTFGITVKVSEYKDTYEGEATPFTHDEEIVTPDIVYLMPLRTIATNQMVVLLDKKFDVEPLLHSSTPKTVESQLRDVCVSVHIPTRTQDDIYEHDAPCDLNGFCSVVHIRGVINPHAEIETKLAIHVMHDYGPGTRANIRKIYTKHETLQNTRTATEMRITLSRNLQESSGKTLVFSL
ncbi:MAG: hypothetical protein JST80_06370 [Bdellovibrionales bacterium]|nr:hypothetical protein [Bdellovibrionales bacterium]